MFRVDRVPRGVRSFSHFAYAWIAAQLGRAFTAARCFSKCVRQDFFRQPVGSYRAEKDGVPKTCGRDRVEPATSSMQDALSQLSYTPETSV